MDGRDIPSSLGSGGRRRRWIVRGVLLAVVLLLGGMLYEGCPVIKMLLGIPPEAREDAESGPVGNDSTAVANGKNHLLFSPDGKYVAYLYRNAVYYYPPAWGARPHTMEDALQVRWFPIAAPSRERSAPLAAVDLRPEGLVYYWIDGAVTFSPDSRRLAALCSETILLIDPASGSSRTIRYEGERFGSLAWPSPDEAVFTTTAQTHLTFWRLNVTGPDDARRPIHRESWDVTPSCESNEREHAPAPLRGDSWSPDRRFVIFDRRASDAAEGLLDVSTGRVRTFPFSLYYHCWKPDGSAVLVNDRFSEARTVALVETETGTVFDLTAEFRNAFGEDFEITLVWPTWTPDGKYVILYTTRRRAEGPSEDTGYIIQPRPFRIILSHDRFLRWSPIPGWALLQGGAEGTCQWINYAGTRTVPIAGWPDWTWSPDRRHAAKISEGKVTVLQPVTPQP